MILATYIAPSFCYYEDTQFFVMYAYKNYEELLHSDMSDPPLVASSKLNAATFTCNYNVWLDVTILFACKSVDCRVDPRFIRNSTKWNLHIIFGTYVVCAYAQRSLQVVVDCLYVLCTVGMRLQFVSDTIHTHIIQCFVNIPTEWMLLYSFHCVKLSVLYYSEN